MDVSIIIVNYNTADITCQAIDSVLQQEKIQAELFVVDNASKDNSVERFKQYGDRIHVIANQDNLGFGKANNLAAKSAQGKYLAIINPDIEFKQKDALRLLASYLEQHQDVGLVGAKIINPDGTLGAPPKMDYPGQKHIKHKFNNLPGQIAWLLGAILFVRKDVFDKIQGFDEDYFLYCEDTDFGLRIRQAGYKIAYNDRVTITHIGQVSSQGVNTYERKIRKLKGTFVFFRKHYTKKEAVYLTRLKLAKARFRLLLLKANHMLKHTEKTKVKYQRYKAMHDLSKQFIQEMTQRT